MKKLRAFLFLCLASLTLLCILRPPFLMEWLGRLPFRQPGLPHPLDWLAHACAFGAFTVFINQFLTEVGLWIEKPYRLKLTLILIAFAAVDEMTQCEFLQSALTSVGLERPYRDPSILDWLADGIGIASATAALAWLKARRRIPTPVIATETTDEPATDCTNIMDSICQKLSESDNEPAT
ncbi:MAG: hypothetical protein ABIH86_02590 [Planctomycetota bacterium]